MLYPDRIEDKLGFLTVRNTLESYCISELGVTKLLKLTFLTTKSEVIQSLNEIQEVREGILTQDLPDLPPFYGINELVSSLSVEGKYLQPDEIVKVRSTLLAGDMLSKHLKKQRLLYSSLVGNYELEEKSRVLIPKINKIIDVDGKIPDTASTSLGRIRKKITEVEHQLRQVVGRVFRSAQKMNLVPDGSGIGLRDGRMVIPVISSYKNKISGFIHDESSTGRTTYIEPAEALEWNNLKRILMIDEKEEIINILTKISHDIFDHRLEIKTTVNFLGIFDLVQAKAKLAIKLGSVFPEISESGRWELRMGRHPQMLLSGGDEKTIVPLNIRFGPDDRFVVLSGPNAGGKSVCLKTIGINQYMLQFGLMPSVQQDSVFSIVSDLFVDIGDEQSIENDLSTYSSHLKNMRTVLEHAGNHSLILIDEFGSGTDPVFGAAVAEALLDYFLRMGCYGIVTTHYGNLKEYASSHTGCSNAAMRFDMEQLLPLYILQQGSPGSSFTLEIARNAGIPKNVLSQAKRLIGKDTIDAENLLKQLENDSISIQKRRKETETLENLAQQALEQYINLKNELESKKKGILEEAQQQANDLLKEVNKEIEKTIRHIKENKAEKGETRKIRKSLEEVKSKLAPKARSKVKKPKVIEGKLIAGDRAVILETGTQVEIMNIKAGRAEVMIGDLRAHLDLSELAKTDSIGREKPLREHSHKVKGLNFDRTRVFRPILDVRGCRADEVLTKLTKWVDDALLSDYKALTVLHGKGNGILRKVVREYLGQLDYVESLTDGSADQGGAGLTEVLLK